MASACSDEPSAGPDAGPDRVEIPRGASLPPLAYTLRLTYMSEPFIIPRPETITGHLYLDVAGDGQVTGTISTTADFVSLAPISGRVQDNEIVIEDADVDVEPDGSLGLEELRIILLDSDGDGAPDGAEGQASGSWFGVQGDIVDQTLHTSTLTAGLDATATSASLFVSRGALTLLPFDPVSVRFQEPLREADVRDSLRILAGGTTVTGELTLTAAGGLVTGASFQSDAFLPFGADVTIDLGDLKDPSGNALVASNARVPVVADPGLLTDNAGFESALDGWIALGQASTEGEFQGFAPVEGAAQAVVRQGGTLAAALDVAADATELDLSVAVLTEIGEVDADRTAVIALRKPGGELIEIFDVADVADQQQDCTTCTDYGKFVGPLRRTLDLTPHRGQRVFLTVDVRSSGFIGVISFAALIDDIQLR
ncbi:MAG TPA: hypothetical protein VNM90_27145 [Haliangium sp.]|nr:hypothetical protein [Haliangium sp.]